MVITFSSVLFGLLAIIRPLQKNPFYIIHSAFVILAAYYVENNIFRGTPFHSKMFLLFVLFHFISISIVTFLAYFFDKRAAQKRSWRVKETDLHTLELVGGWCAGYIAQRVLNHKTKKKKYQTVFWIILGLQLLIIYTILKFVGLI